MFHPDASNEQNEPTMPYGSAPQPYRPGEEQGIYPPASQSYQPAQGGATQYQPSSPTYWSTGNGQGDAYNASTQQQSPVLSSSRYTPPPRPPSRGPRTGAIIVLAVVLLLVLGVGAFAGWQFGRDTTATLSPAATGSTLETNQSQATVPALTGSNLETVREQVVANVSPAVVQVNVTLQNGSALGSGVIIDKRGYIVTNYHVVENARNIDSVVLSNGTKVTNIQLVGTDQTDDLAVLKITPPTTLVTVSFGNSSSLKVGQDVLAIGNPLGNTQTVTSGIVSALGRNVSEGSNGVTLPGTIQTDAPINPGNSGGALVNLQGQLVGIPTLTAIDPEFNAPANGVGFAIPSNRVQFIAEQLIQSGKVTHTGRAALGIYAADVDTMTQQQDNLAVDHGVLVTRLVSNGAAQNAGLRVGDVIVQVNNQAIATSSDLEDALLSENPGDKASVHVYRGTQQLTISVTLGELQASSN